MGANERKTLERQVRKKDIVDAAENIIFSKGYDAATMDDIAKRAEFSKRTIYMYFNSKEQLYFEIMARGYKILINMIDKALCELSDSNAINKIRQIGMVFYNFSKDYPDYFKAIMDYENSERDFTEEEADEAKKECYELGEKIIDYLIEALTLGIEAGELRNDINVPKTSIVLWSSTLGLFNTLAKKSNYLRHYHGIDSEELLYGGFDLLIKSIQCKEGEKKIEK